jgi:hypothetical protein
MAVLGLWFALELAGAGEGCQRVDNGQQLIAGAEGDGSGDKFWNLATAWHGKE